MEPIQKKIRDRRIFRRFLQLGEFYSKKERYQDIAESYSLTWLTVRDIILRQMKERRVK